MTEDPDGRVGRRLDLRGPSSSTSTRSSSRSRSTRRPAATCRSSTARRWSMTAVTYDDMRPGCYDRDARVKDFELNWVDGSLPFPTFPRFCGQTFYEADDKELGLACVAGLQRLDGRGVVRAVRRRATSRSASCRCGTSSSRPRRSSATRTAACARSASASSRTTSSLPSIHTGHWDPVFAGLQRHRRHAVHAHRLVVDRPGGVARRARGRRRHARVQQLDGVARRLAVLAAS